MRKPPALLLLWLVISVAAVVAWWTFRTEDGRRVAGRSDSPAVVRPDDNGLPGVEAVAVGGGAPLTIEDLNAPDGTIERDIEILAMTFEQWLANFPENGNPVGTNAEITAALAGRNPLGLDLIPADHPAINEAGELVDRWGTPFRFHQLSGQVMEIISAGPDRRFATADDVQND